MHVKLDRVLCTYRSIYDKGEREDLEVKKIRKQVLCASLHSIINVFLVSICAF